MKLPPRYYNQKSSNFVVARSHTMLSAMPVINNEKIPFTVLEQTE